MPRHYNVDPHREPPRHIRDLCTMQGAEALAQELQAFWHAQGHPAASFWIEPQRVAGKFRRRAGELLYVVRSNLIGGLPPPSPPTPGGSGTTSMT